MDCLNPAQPLPQCGCHMVWQQLRRTFAEYDSPLCGAISSLTDEGARPVAGCRMMGRAGVRNRKKRSSLSSSFSRDGRTDIDFLPSARPTSFCQRKLSLRVSLGGGGGFLRPPLAFLMLHPFSLPLSAHWHIFGPVLLLFRDNRSQNSVRQNTTNQKQRTNIRELISQRESERASRDPNSVPRTRSKKCRGRGVPKTRDGQQPQ